MSTYTAVIGDARSVGSKIFTTSINVGGSGNASDRLNPEFASCRIRTIIAPHIVSDSVGGFISADFTIPPEEAQLWRPCLKYGVVVWLFDGSTPIFYGYAEQPTWNQDGSVLMNVSGLWTVLSKSRMREAWDLWDISLYQKGQGAVDNKAGSVNQNSNGSLTLSFPGGSTLATNDRCSVDYLLFGETTGTYDQKLITAFEFDVADSANLGTNFRLRVYGKSTAASTGGDLLFDQAGALGSSSIQGALNLAGTNQSGGWISTNGYRCIRVEIRTLSARTPLAVDTYATLDRIRVGTREDLFEGPAQTIDTAAIARDVMSMPATAVSFLLNDNISPEFWPSAVAGGSPDSNSYIYRWGLDPITGTGTAPNSGFGITGFNSLEWQAPTDILAELAAIDGAHVGFYLPYNGRGGYDSPGNWENVSVPEVGSWWLTAPPQLYYQQFPDPNYAPDYTIHTREGAQVDETTDIQPLISGSYVNYNTRQGKQLSVAVVDTDLKNYLYAQGYRRNEDWTLQPSVGNDQQATRLANQTLALRRQPYASATITLYGDGSQRYPILKQGAVIPKLATIRPGSVRIVDMPAASGLRAGYATQVEWWGQTLTDPEKVQITLGQPGQHTKPRRVGHIVHGDLHTPRRRRLAL